MNLENIMLRNVVESTERNRLTLREPRKPTIATTAAFVVLIMLAIGVLACAFVWGYACGIEAEIELRQEQSDAWQACEARIDAKVRAMSNYELIAATERDAAKYKK